MGRNLKIKNKETGEWEVAASGNLSGISSNNPRFLKEGEVVISADELVNRIDDKVGKLERNVSWLAIYGGSGSGSGGGDEEASIVITNASQNQGANMIYTSDVTVKLNYLINAKRNNQKYLISVVLDGNDLITNQVGWSGVSGVIVIDDIAKYSDLSTHNITITLTDSEGMNSDPYLLTVVESSIRLTSRVTGVTATIGLPYKITYGITNKVVNKETSLVVENITNGISKTYELGVFSSTSEILFDISFFDDLFPSGTNPTTGSSYTIQAYAQTTVDTGIVKSNVTTNRVIIEDGVNLVVLIDGITTNEDINMGYEPTLFAQDGNVSFSFTPYLAGVSIVYYALRLTNGSITKDVGIFEPTNENPITSNQYTQRGSQQIFSWSIPQESDYIGDWTITLRCWSEKGSPMVDTVLKCRIEKAGQALLEDQNPNGSRFANWDIKLSTFPQNPVEKVWNSIEREYKNPGSLTPVVNTSKMNVYNTNGTFSGFLVENGQNKLRLAGEAYAVIDVSPFSGIVDTSDNWGTTGFSFSFTFKTDKHPFSDRTVAFIGDYSSVDGSLQQGIKIGLEDVTWKYKDGDLDKTISCKIQQNVVNCVDFVLRKVFEEYKNPDTGQVINSESWVVEIYVNGVPNKASELTGSFSWRTDSKIYLACDVNENGVVGSFSDVEFYNVKLFRYPLNDKEVVINSMNSRAKANLNEDGTVKFTEYNNWKNRNFFPASTGDPIADAASSLWNDVNGTFNPIYFSNFISDANRKPPLPVMLIECTESSGFTRAVYEKIGANTAWYNGCNLRYFDPNSSKGSTADTSDVSIQIQGTSSTGYRSKNLDIRFNKRLENGEVELFQPVDTWMPENQFTLKADVVDSAHANNASIGKWINDNADVLFDKTPPMVELESHRPVDTYENSIVHDKVTIKHTLEGFPIILLIRFSGESTDTMLGVYSFNLGRSSFYNMGFKFFKSFTVKNKTLDGQIADVSLPAFVTNYETYKENELFGSIDQRQIYSYEFSENANTIESPEGIQPTALFWQDDLSIIKHVGEFRYNGSNGTATNVTDDAVWKRLQLLFSCLSRMTGSQVQKYSWDNNNRSYKPIDGQFYTAENNWSTYADLLNQRLSLKNAYSYFMICVAFGLVDSLGKNMVLRSWNVGGSLTDENMNKWYPCFYDMDTANGLSNTGEENVKKTSYIDVFKNAEVENGVNSLQIIQNSADGGYDTYSSRLWDVLRSPVFINTGINNGLTYSGIWNDWRRTSNLINDANYFIDNYFSSQTKECGELLFAYDYKIKYLTKYISQGSSIPSYANVTFLHGTRTEYVRDWLKKRFYFFDGVYMYNNADHPFPYNTKGTFSCGGALSSNPILKVKCNTPMIFTVNIGQTTYGDISYFIDENVQTDVVMMPISSFNMQVTINAVNEISELGGLKDMRFQRFMPGLMSLPSFSDVNLKGVSTFENEPVDFATVFVSGERDYSEVRHIDLSNTKFWTGSSVSNPSFTADLSKYVKLKTLNISNSCVTATKLPSAALSELNISNSAITQINIESQPFLESIDFTGCNKLTSVVMSNCSKIKQLVLNNLSDLRSVRVTACPNLTSIVCTNNKKMNEFIVEAGCLNVKDIDLSNCNNPSLRIYLVGALNVRNLNVSGTTTEKTIEMASSVTEVDNLILNNSSVTSIQFGSKPVPVYREEKVLDLSNVIVRGKLSMNNMNSVKYIKFDNNRNNPVDISGGFFNGCSSLIRIFGHIRINGTSTFRGCSNFHIHDLSEEIPTPIPMETEWYGPDTSTSEGKSLWDAGSELGTNITIATENMSSQFRETSCNLTDVYYILSRCHNVTTLNSCFYGCKKIETSSEGNSFRRNMFRNCGKVTSISTLFYSCGSLDGIYYSPEHDENGNVIKYNGLLSPLKNLVDIGGAFESSGVKYMDDMFFSGADNDSHTFDITSLGYVFDSGYSSVKFINNTSPSGTQKETVLESDYSYAKASRLLKCLPKLKTISGMFNGAWIEFDLERYELDGKSVDYCPMFYNNKDLTDISLSFRNLTGKGSMVNIFGGNEIFDLVKDHFPQRLSTIRNSFNITNGSVSWVISNDMFNKIKSTLKYITGQDIGNITYGGTGSSFNGSGIVKTFASDGSNSFPYDVFKGCTELIEIPAFFTGIRFSSDPRAELPGDMFINNKKLSNISHLFDGMYGITYTLTGKGFINCSIVNASYCFNENSGSYSKTGFIPYGLFYQENVESKKIKGWTANNSNGIDENFGIDSDGNWIEDATLPNPPDVSFSRTLPNKTITNMYQCLGYFQSRSASGYSKNIGNLTPNSYGDVVIPNELYNPVKYLKNPLYSPEEMIKNPNYDEENPLLEPEYIPNTARDIRRVILNPDYNGYKKSWNKWCVDGIYGLKNSVENSQLYKSLAGNNPLVSDLPLELPEEFDIIDDSKYPQSTNYPEKRLVMNYICPPDLFRYCINKSSGVNINYALYNSGREETTGIAYSDYGLPGRIPPHIFEPVSNISSIIGVFYLCKMLNPSSWPQSNLDRGDMYPRDLFKKMPNINDITLLFALTEIQSGVSVPDTLFSENINLRVLDRLWMGVKWNGSSSEEQLPGTLFSNNSNISNVRGMLSSYIVTVNNDGSSTCDVTNHSGRPPKKLNGEQLFNSQTHKSIQNCSWFLSNGTNTTGTIPQFWTWLSSISSNGKTSPFYGVYKSKISNISGITSDWSSGMRD